MARFILASILLVGLACACCASPQNRLTKDLVENSQLEITPAEIKERFFFDFFFRPRPWIPLPITFRPRPTTTTAPPANPPPPAGGDSPPETPEAGGDEEEE